MTTARAIESNIIRRLQQRPEQEKEEGRASVRWADRLIAVSAATAALFIVGAYLEELLWVILAALTVFALGSVE